MVAYFDIENLESFLQQPKNEFYYDCLRLLQKQLDLTFNFSKENFKKSEDLMNFTKIFGDGVGEKQIKFIPEKFPMRNIKSNSHKDFTHEQLLSVYFINCVDLKKLQNKDDLIIADIGEELTVFRVLFLHNTDYKLDRKLRIGNEFNSWSVLKKYNSPHIDIIIVDNFILSDKSLIQTNLKGIIENSLSKKSRKKLNIIIFIKLGQLNSTIEEIKQLLNPVVEGAYDERPYITIVQHSSEHDRTILKGPLRIYSGDSFNYFKSDGSKTTAGKEVHLSSIADKENYNLYLESLNDFQTIINKASIAGNIIGDKKSRFFTFP